MNYKYLLPVYAVVCLFLALFSYLFIDPNFFYLKIIYTGFHLKYREIASLVYFIIISLLFALYFFIIRKGIRLCLKTIALPVVVLIFAYPAMLSFDIFNYLLTAKVLFAYGENPYLIMPVEIPSEPMLAFTHAANKTALYGPVWLILTGIPHFFGMGDFLLKMYLFKTLVVVFHLVLLRLIYKITGDMSAAAFYGLNPLVVLETGLSGHNDVVMMAMALAGLLLLTRNKFFLAVLLMLASILIKFSTLFLLPVFILIWRDRRHKKSDNWKLWSLYGFLAMIAVFFLSPLREEIYPWYGIWFLSFVPLMKNKRNFNYAVVLLSYGLMLRYLPFMLWGTHRGLTPLVKTGLTFGPVLIWAIATFLKHRFFNYGYEEKSVRRP